MQCERGLELKISIKAKVVRESPIKEVELELVLRKVWGTDL